ncbi:CLUMA_CG015058, isoform A [Clunio marinus]|uniref:CLUMA_CG015058, isoform A n=1 Tax=Clunio marinus TaxID=568069 RepID=A0A1J1IQY5_9DIPT|nr:CLUMA_CG015058, isoform A [Clunio marinus]
MKTLMINLNIKDISETFSYSKAKTFLIKTIDLILLLIADRCRECNEMSRITMSCYAAAKHPQTGEKGTVARNYTGKGKKHPKNYENSEALVELDKYNGKMMFSIWGLYNRNSPHNFKKQNAENVKSFKEQETNVADVKMSFVQFSIPQLTGIVSVEVKKPKTTLEKLENLMNFPN